MATPDLGFVHLFEWPADADGPILLLLHGTGGNEHDLVPFARAFAPRAGILSPRGRVLERGMPRFFRRLSEGVFDEEDVRHRSHQLADFVIAAAGAYDFDRRSVVAVGFSNGANIAAAVLLLRPGVLQGAILFRAMVPLVPERMPVLPATPVLVSNGRADPFAVPAQTDRLVVLLRNAGARVTLEWQQAGHNLTPNDVAVARDWLETYNREAEQVEVKRR